MHAAHRDQPLGIFLHVIGDELVDRRGEADHFGRDIVDQHRAIDADGVQMLQKAFGERQYSATWSKSLRDFFISASASGLNNSSG